MLVDPAYRLEKLKEMTEKTIAMQLAYLEVDKQTQGQTHYFQVPLNKTVYENWWKIEKSILKFDRFFNKVEKFETRHVIDPVNHDRREKRMLERKSQRYLNSYNYYFGGLTEEE